MRVQCSQTALEVCCHIDCLILFYLFELLTQNLCGSINPIAENVAYCQFSFILKYFEPFKTRSIQVFTIVGMCNIDQFSCPLP